MAYLTPMVQTIVVRAIQSPGVGQRVKSGYQVILDHSIIVIGEWHKSDRMLLHHAIYYSNRCESEPSKLCHRNQVYAVPPTKVQSQSFYYYVFNWLIEWFCDLG